MERAREEKEAHGEIETAPRLPWGQRLPTTWAPSRVWAGSISKRSSTRTPWSPSPSFTTARTPWSPRTC
jgi:hypothetical protein